MCWVPTVVVWVPIPPIKDSSNSSLWVPTVYAIHFCIRMNISVQNIWPVTFVNYCLEMKVSNLSIKNFVDFLAMLLDTSICSLQAVLNDTEEFILSIDELSNEVCSASLSAELLCCLFIWILIRGWSMQIVIWDALTAEKVARWPSNHIGAPRWLEHSPTEAAFISCGTDRSVRFWKETL